VTLINSDGIALIGPGSEWFWTMAQFVAVVVTLVAIYRQLRAQGSSNALARLEALSSRYESRSMTLARLHTALSLRFDAEPTATRAMRQVDGFFADLENLDDGGHITLVEVDYNWGSSMRVWRALMKDALARSRVIDGEAEPRPGRLLRRIEERARKRGDRPIVIDDTNRGWWLDEAIRRTTDALQLLNEGRRPHDPEHSGRRPTRDAAVTPPVYPCVTAGKSGGRIRAG
jgi:hypothetical protein